MHIRQLSTSLIFSASAIPPLSHTTFLLIASSDTLRKALNPIDIKVNAKDSCRMHNIGYNLKYTGSRDKFYS
jgi:hypothetical protein